MMNTTLTKSAQKVQDVLLARGLAPNVVELPGSTRTAIDAASIIGCEVAQIVKSLIFKTKQGDKPVLVLASGPNRVNEATIESQVGEKIVKADADFTKEVTGFAIGGIPPVGHAQKIDFIFIDEALLKFDSVWAAAGTPNAVFNLGSRDLLAMTGGTVLSIK
jgi:prolyl-tRNA editing enzyme YbaK/EbsC (Cys-tRNA(Pro) deacylase)